MSRGLYQKVLQRVKKTAFAFTSRHQFFSSLYYYLFNVAFNREQRSVIAGRTAFDACKNSAGPTNSLLRRNVHRLEKGLIMRPRRDVFGLDYIGETMLKYNIQARRFDAGGQLPDPEFQWFRDVLMEYFAVTASHPGIDRHRKQFAEIENRLLEQTGAGTHIPFRQDVRVPTSIAYEEYLSLCAQRKSVRWFLNKTVPHQEILKVLEVARFAPSACNRYPFFFQVFDEKEKVAVVSRLPGGTVGFAQNFPVIIAIIGELRNYYGERDRHLIYVDASLAAMSVVLAAETLGLATCCINWPDIEEHEKRADRVLQLEQDQRPIMFMAMGYPDPEGTVAYSQKKPISEICRFNSDLGQFDG